MSMIRVLAVLLVLGGAGALAYGTFSYTSESHDAKIGPLEFSVKERETVHIPQWMGAAAIAAGVLLLVVGRK
jgi:TRAP-type C4-dicarboxylate transport system permease small subunit